VLFLCLLAMALEAAWRLLAALAVFAVKLGFTVLIGLAWLIKKLRERAVD
jgi:hypothetical protein